MHRSKSKCNTYTRRYIHNTLVTCNTFEVLTFRIRILIIMSNSGKGTFQPDSDVHISYEDQQKINKFARLNAKVDDLKDELKVKRNDMKNLEEAVEELSLSDDSEKTPYLIGEVFVCLNLEETIQSLEKAKTKKEFEISELESKCEELKSQMTELKAHLYGKFGSHIHLENEEE